MISLPFLWMVEYTTNPNQCYLNMSSTHLAYFFCFNVMLIIFPTIALVIIYMMIIVKLKRRDTPFAKILNLNQLEAKTELTDNTLESSQSMSRMTDLEREKIFELKPLKSWPMYAPSQNCVKKKIESKLKHTINISILSVIFYCFQLPARLILCWSYLNDTVELKYESSNSQSLSLFDFLLHLVILVYYLHCVSNPFIYNMLSSKFRKSFLKLNR